MEIVNEVYAKENINPALLELSAEEKEKFTRNYNYYKKSYGIGFMLALLGGLHYAYLGNWKMQALMLITIWGVGIWWFIDIFRVNKLIKDYNQQLANRLISGLKNAEKMKTTP